MDDSDTYRASHIGRKLRIDTNLEIINLKSFKRGSRSDRLISWVEISFYLRSGSVGSRTR